jgi:hypothetical protein
MSEPIRMLRVVGFIGDEQKAGMKQAAQREMIEKAFADCPVEIVEIIQEAYGDRFGYRRIYELADFGKMGAVVCATKRAIHDDPGLMRSLEADLHKKNIRVFELSPP